MYADLPVNIVVPFLNQLVREAPNLQFFTLSDYEQECCEFESPFALFTDLVVCQIVQLKDLRHLCLCGAGYFTDDQLLQLTKHLKNLVILKVIFK